MTKQFAVALLLFILIGCDTTAPEPPPYTRPAYSFAECKTIIQDPFRYYYDVLYAIQDIRAYPAQDVPAKFWSDIANSTIYTPEHRRYAVLQLVDRYIQPQWTLKQIGDVLSSPTWLRQDEISYLNVPHFGTGPGPFYPVDLDRGDSLVRIRICLPTTDDSVFYLRIGARPTTEQIYAALTGKPSDAAGIPVKEIAPFLPYVRQIGGTDWRGGRRAPVSEQSN